MRVQHLFAQDFQILFSFEMNELFLSNASWTKTIGSQILRQRDYSYKSISPSVWSLLGEEDLNFLFVWGFSSQTRIFHSVLDYWWRVTNFDRCSALMANDQWWFFNVPHQLWHGPVLYNGHLRGPVTFTPVAERLAGELIGLSRPGFGHRSPACEANALPLSHRGGRRSEKV